MTSHMAPTLQARHFIQVQTYLSTQEPYLGSQQTKGLFFLPNLLSLFQGGSLKTKDASLILPVLIGPHGIGGHWKVDIHCLQEPLVQHQPTTLKQQTEFG